MLLDTNGEKEMFARKLSLIQDKGIVPQGLLDLLAAVQAVQAEARKEASIVLPPEEELAAVALRIQGAPLLDKAEMPYDAVQARALFPRLLEICQEAHQGLRQSAKVVEEAVAGGELELDTLFQHFLNGDSSLFDLWADKTPQAPRVLYFLTQAAVTPSLSAAAEKLAELLDQEAVWPHGHCPVCGSQPLIGMLREQEGFRHLACSFCRHEYRAKRLGCPYCGEEDPEKVSFYMAEEEPGFRVYVCKGCNMYIKTVDFRKTGAPSIPALDDLESLPLDVLAAEMGFTRPTLSGWGF